MKRFLTVTALAAILCGCSDDDSVDVGAREVKIADAAIANNETAKKWVSGDQLGVFLFQESGNELVGGNVAFSTAGDGSFAAADANNKLMFPANSSNQQFTLIAYYPYTAAVAYTAANGIPYSVENLTDQTTQAKQDAVDLMLATQNQVAPTSEAVKLSFNHLLAKVELNISGVNGIEKSDLAGMTVKIVGTKATAKVDLAQKAPAFTSLGATSGINALTAASNSGVVATALAIPQQLAASELAFELQLPALGKTFTVKHANATELTSGKKHSFTVTVSPSEAVISGSSIADWDNKPADNGTADFIPMPTMKLTIDTRLNTANPSDKTFIVPMKESTNRAYDLVIAWGDGSKTTVKRTEAISLSTLTHEYATAGVYQIAISSSEEDYSKAQIPSFGFYDNYSYINSNSLKLTSIDDPLLNTAGYNLQNTFRECANLKTIHPDIFKHCKQASSFNSTFKGCKSFTGPIPENLFANNTEATGFICIFEYCESLTGTIPENLFAKNIKATDFTAVFGYCKKLTGGIPEKLFANNPKARYIASMFYFCNNLTGTIPEKLFANNPEVTSFSNVFAGCSELTGTIPENLFANNPEVTDFNSAFYYCHNLSGSIPENLFANNKKAADFGSTFSNCGVGGEIPAKLFANNPEATNFTSTLNNNSRFTKIPQGLFDNNPKATTFEFVFSDCSGIKGNVPDGLFEKNVMAVNFKHAFTNCSATITPNIFSRAAADGNTRFKDQAVTFESCFKDTRSGTAPELWKYSYGTATPTTTGCFTNARLTNSADIPATWK